MHRKTLKEDLQASVTFFLLGNPFGIPGHTEMAWLYITELEHVCPVKIHNHAHTHGWSGYPLSCVIPRFIPELSYVREKFWMEFSVNGTSVRVNEALFRTVLTCQPASNVQIHPTSLASRIHTHTHTCRSTHTLFFHACSLWTHTHTCHHPQSFNNQSTQKTYTHTQFNTRLLKHI